MPGPDAGPAAVGALFYRAAGHAMRGQFAASQELGALLLAAGGPAAAPIEAVRLCWLEVPRGDVEAAEQRLRAALSALERSDPLNQRAVVGSSLAMALTDVGEHAEAERWWREVIAIVDRDGREPMHRGIAQLYLALSRGRAGDADGAERELAPAGPIERYGARAHLGHAALAHAAAVRGDAPGAMAAARRALAAAATGTGVDRMWALEECVPLLAAQGAPDAARATLAETLAAFDELYPGPAGSYYRARTLALRAWLQRDDEPAALADLERAWRLAGPVRPGLLRRQRATLAPLLELAMRRRTVAPAAGLAALAAADPGSDALVRYVEDPDPAVRAAAIGPAAASGRRGAAQAVAARVEDPDPQVRRAARGAAARLAAEPLPLAVRTLGGFELRRGPTVVDRDEWGRPHAAKLVRFLLVQGDAAVSEDALFAALWPERAGTSARGALHVAVSRARAVLDASSPGNGRLIGEQRTYRLRLGAGDTIDAARFRGAADAALAAPGPDRRALLEHAAGLWGGEPLPEDGREPWARAWREELQGGYAAVLRALVAECERAGDRDGATLAAHRLVALDPLDESAHRHLMLAYARGGRRAHALRAFLDCRRSLVAQLGIEPAQETARLQARILAGEPV